MNCGSTPPFRFVSRTRFDDAHERRLWVSQSSAKQCVPMLALQDFEPWAHVNNQVVCTILPETSRGLSFLGRASDLLPMPVDPVVSARWNGFTRREVLVTADSGALIERPAHTRTQHAIRLLVLLDRTGEPVTDGDPPAAVKALRSELRLQAMDFWMRNPDYLADELIAAVESGDLVASFLDVARSLLDDPEPDLHYYPMPRWFYGAYEAIDDAMALLETYGLATFRRSGAPGSKSHRNQMFLTAPGARAVASLTADPVLHWYVRQAELVALVAGDTVGSKLKERQYEQATYAGTELGLDIAPIAEYVRDRLDRLESGAAGSGGGGA